MSDDDRQIGIPPDTFVDESMVFPLSEELPSGAWHVTPAMKELHRRGVDGRGVTVAVNDTAGQADHPFLPKEKAGRIFTGESSPRDGNGHGCVAPWDKVMTSLCGLQTAEYLFNNAPGIAHLMDGATIKDVSRYDVFTASADPVTGEPIKAKVLAVHKLRHKGNIYEVKTKTGLLTLTPWHPVYVLKSCTGKHRRIAKVRADCLKVGDNVLTAGVTDIGAVVALPYRKRFVCVYCGHEARGSKRPQCKKCNKCSWHEGPTADSISLDEDLAFWLGLVASDGHLSKLQRCVDFCGIDDRIGSVYSDLCIQLFGVEPKVYTRKGSRVKTWRLNCDDAHRLANEIGIPVGNKSTSLTVPNLITKSPRAVILSFIAGLLEGDGHVRKKTRLTTGSKSFAQELKLLLNMLGIASSVSKSEKCFNVIIGGDQGILSRLRVKDGSVVANAKPRISTAIESIEVKPYDGLMYDLTVEGTSTYACNGHIVSNTHVMGIVISVAPKAALICAKVLSNGGSGSTTGINAGRVWAAEQGADVISESLGDGGGPPIPSDLAAYDQAYAAGTSICVAALGNAGYNGSGSTIGRPGSYSGHNHGIAAIQSDWRTIAGFSSGGPQARFASPGAGIISCRPGGGWVLMSGTSMATPWQAGLYALIISWRRGLGLPDLKGPKAWSDFFVDNQLTVDLGSPGWDARYGNGLVDASKVFQFLLDNTAV